MQLRTILSALFLAHLTCMPAQAQSTTEGLPALPALSAVHAEQAAQSLTTGLRSKATASELGELKHAIELSMPLLGKGRQAHRLMDAKRKAEWTALFERERAIRNLRATLSEVADDLRFQPRIEANLPEGWPAPAAVGEFEIKHYPAYRMGQTRNSTSRSGRARANGSFWTLFQHIQSNDIAMTAPVEMTYEESGERLRESAMAFLYRSTSQGKTGMQGNVEVTDVAPLTTLSIGCRGARRRSGVAQHSQELLAWVASHPHWRVAGPLRAMGYNSPMVPDSKRYFEMELPIEWVDAKTPPVKVPAPPMEEVPGTNQDESVPAPQTNHESGSLPDQKRQSAL